MNEASGVPHQGIQRRWPFVPLRGCTQQEGRARILPCSLSQSQGQRPCVASSRRSYKAREEKHWEWSSTLFFRVKSDSLRRFREPDRFGASSPIAHKWRAPALDISDEYAFGPLRGQLEVTESVSQESCLFCEVSEALLFLGRDTMAKLPPVLGQDLVQLHLCLLETLKVLPEAF